MRDLLCVRCVCFVDLKSQLAAVPLSSFYDIAVIYDLTPLFSGCRINVSRAGPV